MNNRTAQVEKEIRAHLNSVAAKGQISNGLLSMQDRLNSEADVLAYIDRLAYFFNRKDPNSGGFKYRQKLEPGHWSRLFLAAIKKQLDLRIASGLPIRKELARYKSIAERHGLRSQQLASLETTYDRETQDRGVVPAGPAFPGNSGSPRGLERPPALPARNRTPFKTLKINNTVKILSHPQYDPLINASFREFVKTNIAEIEKIKREYHAAEKFLGVKSDTGFAKKMVDLFTKTPDQLSEDLIHVSGLDEQTKSGLLDDLKKMKAGKPLISKLEALSASLNILDKLLSLSEIEEKQRKYEKELSSRSAAIAYIAIDLLQGISTLFLETITLGMAVAVHFGSETVKVYFSQAYSYLKEIAKGAAIILEGLNIILALMDVCYTGGWKKAGLKIGASALKIFTLVKYGGGMISVAYAIVAYYSIFYAVLKMATRIPRLIVKHQNVKALLAVVANFQPVVDAYCEVVAYNHSVYGTKEPVPPFLLADPTNDPELITRHKRLEWAIARFINDRTIDRSNVVYSHLWDKIKRTEGLFGDTLRLESSDALHRVYQTLYQAIRDILSPYSLTRLFLEEKALEEVFGKGR